MSIPQGKRPLAETHPELAKQWSSKNVLRADEVMAGSNKKTWWLGACGHEWEAVINSRVRGNGCPYCAGQKVLPGFNDLATVDFALASQWSNRNVLRTDEVTAKSGKKVWWMCEKGHEWEAVISHRTNGTGCPVCAGKNVFPGFNDLTTTHPDLAEEWSIKNTLTSNEVTHGSNFRVLWECNKGHEWEAKIADRAAGRVKCPVCALEATRKASNGINDLETTHPYLANQWSERNKFKATEVKPRSKEKYWWVCEKGHEWESSFSNRVAGNGCPVCAGRVVLPGFNDVATTNPDLIPEWHSNNTVTPQQVTQYSHKRILWECSEGHEWKTTVANRSNGTECPICKNRVVLLGYNDLNTTHPEIASQWSPNNITTPDDIVVGSHKIIEWVCKKGHFWKAPVGDRLRFGCPKCSHKVSSQELEISTFLQLHGISPDDILLSTRKIIPPKELDIYLPSHNLAIEFNGLYWHSEESGKASDYHLSKHAACAERGIQLLTIWEDDWRDRRPIVERMLKEKLGISDEPRVAARKTKVVLLTRQEIAPFMQMYHIQGAASGSYYLGLKEKGTDNLVAAMILTRRGDTLTLDRYATSCNVPGGHSKLIAYVQREIPFSSLITFADLCISDGALYEKTGWTRDTILAPDYRYIYNGERAHKFNFRKKRFRDNPDLLWEEGLTERQLAELNGLQKVWDCGKIRYRQEKND